MDTNKDTHRVYDEIAELYAAGVKTKPFNAYLERPAIRALVPDIRGARVLDAGCGPGTNISWLIEQGAQEVVGVDASAQMIAIASREAPADASLHVADLNRSLDFLADSTVDLVFSSLVVHYIEDHDRLFAEFARLLRPGGTLLFSTHHPQADFQHHPGNYFATEFVYDVWNFSESVAATVSFYRRPLSAITEALANANMVIERLTETQPTADFHRVDPERYEKVSKRPTFLCVRARHH